MKHLMSGNEATARGVYEAGIKVCSAYPGTPSTEITEFAAKDRSRHIEWAPNEKVAAETAVAASIGSSGSAPAANIIALNSIRSGRPVPACLENRAWSVIFVSAITDSSGISRYFISESLPNAARAVPAAARRLHTPGRRN